MQTGPELVGVLVAGYGLDEAVASQIRKLTHSEIAFLVQPRAGGAARRLLAGPARGRPGRRRLEAGARPGGRDALRDRPSKATATSACASRSRRRPARRSAPLSPCAASPRRPPSFRQFRNSLVLVSLGVMALGLVAAWGAAARITGPVRKLVSLVERVREGSYTGSVAVQGRDEIGVLARAFNGLLADLREKDQMISFLRDGMTAMRQATAITPAPTVGASGAAPASPTEATLAADAPTVATPSVGATAAGAVLGRGQVFAGRYEVLGTLGKGGMGVVYRARDRQLDEVVALKLLRPEALAADPTLLERFKQELKLARRITHRNVLRTHDFGETAGVPYISMEYIDGVTLKEVVHSRAPSPRGRPLDRQADVPRARRRPRRRRRPPRHQAPQHADPPGDGRAEDHGLRHLARVVGRARIGGAHHRGHRHGDPRLHAA